MGYTARERQHDMVQGLGICTCNEDQLEEDLLELFTGVQRAYRICNTCVTINDIMVSGSLSEAPKASKEWAVIRLARATREMERERPIQVYGMASRIDARLFL